MNTTTTPEKKVNSTQIPARLKFHNRGAAIRILITLTLITGICSCKSSLNKSIFEPLTVNDLKREIKRDSLFERAYKYIQLVKDSMLKTDLDKAKWADLTYKRVYKYIKFSNDTNYFKPIGQKLDDEWKEKYSKYQIKVDSISDYWKQYKSQNSLEQYVKVELVAIQKEYYAYIGGIQNVNLGFRLTPLQGQVGQVRFGYRIEAKINEKDSEYASIYSSLNNSWCLSTTPISSPVVRYWEANYTNERILKSETLETFNRDYNIYIEVDEIRKVGRNMSKDDLKIPESVQNHWRYEKYENLKYLHASDIVKEMLNEEYKSKYEYQSEGIEKVLKKKDSLAFKFVSLAELL